MTGAGTAAISGDDLRRRMADLERIGLGPNGTTRLAWTEQIAAANAWFAEQSAGLGLACEADAAGNMWATPASPAPWWAVGSHLDSVRDGGRFDGALGVVAGFAIAARCSRPVAVLAFADEEGARFNTPTFGSRALTGVLEVDDVLGRVDEEGETLGGALRAAGVDPAGLRAAPAALGRLRGFVELHIDQSRDVDAAGARVGVVSALAARARVRVAFAGRADHAGTTPMDERGDALGTAARVITSALDAAAAEPELRVTPGRLLARPNTPTTIASDVTLWMDARAGAPAILDGWLAELGDRVQALSHAGRVAAELRVESRSEATPFDEEVRARLRDAAAAAGQPAPELVCWAGHDAGLLARRVPAAMVLVRNPTGISHAAAEEVDLDDAAVAATTVVRALEQLA